MTDPTRTPYIKPVLICLAIMLGIVFAIGCQEQSPLAPTHSSVDPGAFAKANVITTGGLQLAWTGGHGAGAPDVERTATAEFSLRKNADELGSRGEFVFQVLNADGTLHRRIEVSMTDVGMDDVLFPGKSWALGTVISDTRGCNGNGQGGHEEGCDGQSGGGGGGGGHEPGCDGSHDEGEPCQGGGGETIGHDGGCSDAATGGCGGGGEDDGHAGCDSGGDTGCDGHSGGGGGSGGQGATCRVGQVLALKVHDAGTPGVDGDCIRWRWYAADDPIVTAGLPASPSAWPHLCEKTITGGNLVHH